MEVIITHGDMDGVAAAGLYLYLRDNPESVVYFTEPYNLHNTIDHVTSFRYEKLVITDLGINPSTYRELVEKLRTIRELETGIVWYDHHVWNENWIKGVREIGVELHLDTSTCATGVVAKYTKPLKQVNYEYVNQLVKGVCAGDLWRFDHWMGSYYIRLIRRKDKDSWKMKVLLYIANGQYWNSEFNSKVERHVDLELSLLSDKLMVYTKNINNHYRVAVVEDEEIIDSSFIAPYVMGRYNANIVVVTSSNGKISFRSRDVNVRDLAVRLGGGGHPYAAGAKIKVPWYIRLLSKIQRKLLLVYVANLVTQELERVLTYSGK